MALVNVTYAEAWANGGPFSFTLPPSHTNAAPIVRTPDLRSMRRGAKLAMERRRAKSKVERAARKRGRRA